MKSYWKTTSFNECCAATVAVLALFLVSLPCHAQKRATADGGAKKGDAVTTYPDTPPTPRTAEGHPDFSGLYFPGLEDPDNFKVAGRVSTKYESKAEKPSYQPWVLEKIKLIGSILQNENLLGCPPMGAAGFFFKFNQAIQFVQLPKMLVILSEQDTTYRIIYTEPGRQHPKPDDVYPLFMGDAVGHWEGDTLVVDTVGVDTHTWVGMGPLFVSDVAHFSETFRRPNLNTFLYQVTIDDPKVLTKPWKSPVVRYTWSSHKEIEENYCTNLPDIDDGLIVRPTVPKTATGADERYFDEQEYEELSKKYSGK